MALVIDECGGVLGLLTATDLLEALVGDLPAGTSEEQRIIQRSDGSWLVDGSLPIHELKELLKISDLPGGRDGPISNGSWVHHRQFAEDSFRRGSILLAGTSLRSG